jgi:Predicted solute binding protein
MKNRIKNIAVFAMVLIFSGVNIKTYADNVVSNETNATQTTTGSAIEVTKPEINNVDNTTPSNTIDTGTPSNNIDTTPTINTGDTGTQPNTDNPVTTPPTGETTTPPATTPTVPPLGTIDPNLQANPIEAPTISVSVSTSSLDFGNVNTVSDDDLPYLTVTVQSSSKYKLSVLGDDDFKGDDGSHSMSIEHLKVKLKGENSFKNMKKNPVMLADNQVNTDSKSYNVEFKLNPDWQVKSGKYGTAITFEVEAIQ